MQKQVGRVCSLLLLTGCLFLLGGCGNISIDIHSVFSPNGSFTRTCHFVFAGMLAGMANDRSIDDKFRSEGWTVNTYTDKGNLNRIVSKKFSSVKELNYDKNRKTDNAQDVAAKPNLKFERRISFPFQYYKYEESFGASKEMTQSIQDTDKEVEAMMKSMFSMSNAVEMPGTVVSSNSDGRKEKALMWNISFADFEKGFTMTATSRTIHFPSVVLAFAGLCVLVFLIVYTRMISKQQGGR